MWCSEWQLEPAKQALEREWKKRPYVALEKTTTEQLERDLNGEVLREKTNLMGSAAFKVLNAIGRHFEKEWTEPLALQWFEAAEKTRRDLDSACYSLAARKQSSVSSTSMIPNRFLCEACPHLRQLSSSFVTARFLWVRRSSERPRRALLAVDKNCGELS